MMVASFVYVEVYTYIIDRLHGFVKKEMVRAHGSRMNA